MNETPRLKRTIGLPGAVLLSFNGAVGAAIECETDPASIASALGRALELDEPGWRAMSNAALGLARGAFSAKQVMRQWVGAYRELAA